MSSNLVAFICCLSVSYRSPGYMKRVCPVSCIDMKQSPPREECKDIHENCIVWFDDAECQTNDSVKKYCPRSCGICQDTGTTSGADSCKDNHENCSGWAVRLLDLVFPLCFASKLKTIGWVNADSFWEIVFLTSIEFKFHHMG